MLEIAGPEVALLDDPFALRLRGAGAAEVLWHARLRDDDGLVWRARAERAEDLPATWRGKARSAALHSLRPLRIDVRAETRDGRAATRTITRLLVADGVRIRRWRDGLRATLHLPPKAPRATTLIDAREAATAPALAAPLLASRGAIVLTLGAGDPDEARERLAAVPGAGEIQDLDGAAVPLPAGAPGGDRGEWAAIVARALMLPSP
jgi:hypothetical protein